MDCAGFENTLTALLAGDLPEGQRADRVVALRRHAATCSQCGGCDELMNFLELPPAERDLVESPPEEYWEGFNARVSRRIAAAPAPATRAWWRVAAVAAVLLLAVGGIWLLGRMTGTVPGDESTVQADAGEAAAWDESWSRLEALMAEASPAELTDVLDGLPGGDDWNLEAGDPLAAGDEGWLFPETDDLDPESRRKLLDWLDDEAAAERRLTS